MAIPFHPREMTDAWTYVYIKACMQMFVAALFVNCQYLETTQLSSIGYISTVVYPYSGSNQSINQSIVNKNKY